MIKAEHVAFQGKSPQKHCVGDLQLQDGQTQVVPVDEQVAAEVDAQLANSKKEPLAEILANDHVSKAKKEEDEIQHGMGHIIAEIAESARALSISSAKALACVDSESLASSIQQSIAQSLEPNMEYDLKKVCQTLGGESASTQCLTWHCLEQANCLQTICSQRRKRCFESLMQDVHDDHSLDLVDEGLEHIKCFTSGKPGSLKGKLFFTSEDKLGVHEQGRTLPSNLPKIKLWFAGKVATVLKSTVENGGGVKNRILLDLTSSVDDDSVSKWALSMTPLPGMLVLQSPLYLPSWNVRVLKPKEGQLQETPSLIPRKVVRVLPLGGDASYKGELVYLEWNTEYHFKDMSQVELTRAPFREEILEKKSTDGDQTLSKADAAMQLLLKGEEDDFQPIEPGELVAPKVNARLLKHLMN